MSQKSISIHDLPSNIPVFPLEGSLLLPRGQLPLNIFEPRYLQMFEDCLANGRFLGILQPAPPRTPEEAAGPPKLMQTGCLGRITSFSETDDGRMVVSLTGVCRFQLDQEMPVTTTYRQVSANYRPFESDLIADIGALDVNRDGLLEVVRRYLDANGMTADWDGIEQSGNEALVNSLSIISPYGPQEKQALLEADSLAQRAEILIALTEMVLAQMASAQGSNDNSMQ
ncbi:LON peptidase substrate-binding domain-containing protein [Alphaproteobacteria bacterium]|nr:LON peptidase substrate-binding domain-containing protein [Alphaproteobacteria bacterium]MDC0148485.1 LON peptidase substrate-binding domain-containing protein [Alphaproteobacteria bacterium]